MGFPICHHSKVVYLVFFAEYFLLNVLFNNQTYISSSKETSTENLHLTLVKLNGIHNRSVLETKILEGFICADFKNKLIDFKKPSQVLGYKFKRTIRFAS